MPSQTDEVSQPAAARARRAMAAACAGNAVEWYDFAVYGALAVVIAPVFFPTHEGATNLVAAFGVYATAFLARPVGAVLLGRRGDSHGRRGVLVTVILVMTGATAAVGLLPGYATIGLLAPVALVLLRVLQGLAAGGELGVAAVFITEHAPDRRRGRYAAWHTATLALGVAGGLGVGSLLTSLPEDAVTSGVWRLAFLLALPLGLIGLYLRTHAPESRPFTEAQRSGPPVPAPVSALWRDHRRALRTGFALIAAGSLAFNTFFVFLPNHLVATTDRTLSSALFAAVLGLLCGAAGALALGRLSDRVGRRPVVLGSTSVVVVLAVPLLLLARSDSFLTLVLVEAVAGVAIAGMLSVSLLVEMFPIGLRATGLSLTAGLATALIGGTAPLVDQVLFQASGAEVAPALYVLAVACAALAALRSWPETAFRSLP